MRRSRKSLFIIQPRETALFFFYIAAFLFVLNLAIVFFYMYLKLSNVVLTTLVQFFLATGEYNIPALFSTLLLFLAAVLLYAIYRLPGRQIQRTRYYWLLLSGVFLFLSVDEALAIHERLNKVKDILGVHLSRYITSTWIIPYAFLVLGGVLLFIRFFRLLPARTRKLFILSGSIYICASLVLELFESRLKVLNGGVNTLYFFICSVEEFLEMTGVILFLYALLDFMSAYHPGVQLKQKRVWPFVQKTRNKVWQKPAPVVDHPA